jgi:hypothetical protein
VSRFDSARRAAVMGDLVASLMRRPVNLLAFDDVREKLQLRHVVDRGIQEVPLANIVGSINRHREFNRAFLPREESLRERWRDLEQLAEGPKGFPVVELYRVGETYFVVDGHHRVSVLRTLGAATIEARVTEYLTDVPVSPDETVESALIRRERDDFLEATGLEDEYETSDVNGFERLLEHINVHRYFRSIEAGHQIPWEDAVASWRDDVYRPMVAAVRESRILQDFPGRTETDLYLFVMDHLHHLRERYGTVELEQAVAEVRAEHRSKGVWSWLRRLLSGRQGD